VPAGKSVWEIIDIVSKASMPVVLAFTGFYFTRTLNEIQARDSDSRLYTQLMTQREDADTGLRRGMFESALKTFLETRPRTPERHLLNLELLSFNFHETLSLKALFIDVQREIQKSNGTDKEKEELHARLRDLAIRISEKQIGVLREAGAVAHVSFNLDEKTWDPINGFASLDSHVAGTDVTGADRRRYSIQLLALDTLRNQIRVNLQVYGPEHAVTKTPKNAAEFHNWYFYAGFFDFPMIENFRLSHGQRCAVVLTELSEGVARLSLVFFPGSRASLKEKPYYDEVLDELLHTQHSLQSQR
jgi:hypothetical protein